MSVREWTLLIVGLLAGWTVAMVVVILIQDRRT